MFICDICGSDFTLKQNLRRHMKIIHKLTIERYINKDAQHKCYRCKHSFVNISSLRRHEKLKHKNDFIKSFPKTKYVSYRVPQFYLLIVIIYLNIIIKIFECHFV